jgi:hypothetical protein
MKTKTLLFFSLLTVLFSCTSKEEDPIIQVPNNRVNLSALREGQQTTYVRYYTKCDSLEEVFKYTGDTLIVEVISLNDQFYFTEMVTPSSALYLDGSFIEPVEYPVTLLENKLYIPERVNSALLFFYGSDYIYLNPQHDVNLVQEGCRLLQGGQPFIGNDIGSVYSFELMDIKIDNLTSVSCVPMFDVDAYLMYDHNELHLSHVINTSSFLGWSEDQIYGWKMLK